MVWVWVAKAAAGASSAADSVRPVSQASSRRGLILDPLEVGRRWGAAGPTACSGHGQLPGAGLVGPTRCFACLGNSLGVAQSLNLVRHPLTSTRVPAMSTPSEQCDGSKPGDDSDLSFGQQPVISSITRDATSVAHGLLPLSRPSRAPGAPRLPVLGCQRSGCVEPMANS